MQFLLGDPEQFLQHIFKQMLMCSYHPIILIKRSLARANKASRLELTNQQTQACRCVKFDGAIAPTHTGPLLTNILRTPFKILGTTPDLGLLAMLMYIYPCRPATFTWRPSISDILGAALNQFSRVSRKKLADVTHLQTR